MPESDPTASAAAGQSQPHSSHSTLNVPRPGKGQRTPRKVSAQATRLEAVDDSLDPLGPLGEQSAFTTPIASPSEQGPPPPRKEPVTGRNARPTSSSASQPQQQTQSQSQAGLGGMMDSVDLEDDTGLASPKLKAPPPVQPHPQDEGEGPRRQSQPSMSVEQAAKPRFDITVGDPHKVGDLTSSHIVYQVRTKVRRILLAPSFLTGMADIFRFRLRQKLTGSRSLLSVDGTGISFGFTTLYTITIPGWSSLRRRRSKLLADSIQTLWSPGELPWRECLTKLQPIRYCSTMGTSRYSWRARLLTLTSKTRRTGSRISDRVKECLVPLAYLSEGLRGNLSNMTM